MRWFAKRGATNSEDAGRKPDCALGRSAGHFEECGGPVRRRVQCALWAQAQPAIGRHFASQRALRETCSVRKGLDLFRALNVLSIRPSVLPQPLMLRRGFTCMDCLTEFLDNVGPRTTPGPTPSKDLEKRGFHLRK